MGNTTIQSEQIADDAVTGAKIEDAVTIATSVTSPLIDGQNFKVNGAQGTDGQILTSTGSGVAWETPAASGLDKFNVMGTISNRYYSGLYETVTASTFTLSHTSVYYLPFVVWEDCTIDGLRTSINGGTGVSGDVLQIAIYGPMTSAVSNVPHILTTSSIAVDSGYGKSVSITPTAFTKGVYFYAMATNTSSLVIRSFEKPSAFINYITGSSNGSYPGGLYDAQWSENTVNTWPHTFKSSVYPANSAHHNSNVPHFQYLVQ